MERWRAETERIIGEMIQREGVDAGKVLIMTLVTILYQMMGDLTPPIRPRFTLIRGGKDDDVSCDS